MSLSRAQQIQPRTARGFTAVCKLSVRGRMLHLQLVLDLQCVGDKQVVNEDSVVFPGCRAVTLHSDAVCPFVIFMCSVIINWCSRLTLELVCN